MLQTMNLQGLADWDRAKVSHQRVRVLLSNLLPAGMQIGQVGGTVQSGAHASGRVLGHGRT